MAEVIIIMKILYENKNLVVAVKPVGVLSEESGAKQSMPMLLKNCYHEKGIKNPEIYTVHRLDRDVGGVMVFAKNRKTASELGIAVAERKIEKEYLAVLIGCPEKEEGVLEDLLFRDSKSGKTYVTDRMRAGVRDAKLYYRVLGQTEDQGMVLTFVKVRLYTGRTHQIRVQFASRQLPLYGDGRYGGKKGGDKPALFSCRLALEGYFDCVELPEGHPFDLFLEEDTDVLQILNKNGEKSIQ